jgi:hypothetical protein
MSAPNFPIPHSRIAAFCRHWKIRELAIFGSALRGDFTDQSDVDLLVTFSADAQWGLLDHMAMQEELKAMLNRPVDLVSRRAVERSENWLRRQEILSTSRVIFSEPEVTHAA